MFEGLQETISKNRRNIRKMAVRRLPMRRKTSGPFSARWLMIAAVVAVPVALLVRRIRQSMEQQQGMVPATGGMTAIRDLERTHFEEVGKDMHITEMSSTDITKQPEPTVTESHPAAPPMASEDSPVEVSGPTGMHRAMSNDSPVEVLGSASLPRTDMENKPDLTAPDRQIEQQAPPEAAETALDDFRVIEGIGPGITMILHRAGIATFQQLAETPLERLQQLMKESNISQLTDPTTWPEQAAIAATGDWKRLDDLQSQLRAGRRVG